MRWIVTFEDKYIKKYDKGFYKTYRWVKKREEILERDNFECQTCKDRGEVTLANTVHHTKHYDMNPELALTDDNLISLCMDCHNLVHPEKGFNKPSPPPHSERWE